MHVLDAGPPSDIRPGIRHLVNRLEDAAVTVLDATYQVVAWNALATALLGDFSAMAPRDRNLFRRRFLMLDPNAPLHRTSHPVELGLLAASHLRSAARATRMILKSRRSSPKSWPAAPGSRKSEPPTMSRCSAA
jgi:hypothetical protein